MTDTRNRSGIGSDRSLCSSCAETPVFTGMRGSMELKVIAFIVLFSAAGFVWVQMRQAAKVEEARLFRYKDDKGKVVYTDSLEKVPQPQRQAALNDKSIAHITTADYDTYLDGVSVSKKEEQTGFFESLKQLLRGGKSEPAKPEGAVVGVTKKATPESKFRKDKEEQNPPTDLKGMADIPKVVNESFTAISNALGGN